MNSQILDIRPATSGDLAEIQTCAREAFAAYVERIGQEPAPMNANFAVQIEQGKVSVAFYGSAFAGYVVFYGKGDHLHLENIAVSPAYAGKGVGRKLVAFVEHAARQQGYAAVELYTNEAMTENLLMYPRLGFFETGRRQQDGFKRVFFRKSL